MQGLLQGFLYGFLYGFWRSYWLIIVVLLVCNFCLFVISAYFQDFCSPAPAEFNVLKSLTGFLKAVFGQGGLEVDFAGGIQDTADVLAGNVGDGFYFFFQPEVAGVVQILEGVLIASFFADGVDYQATAGGQVGQGFANRKPGRGGIDDGLAGLGGTGGGRASPISTQAESKVTGGLPSGKDIDPGGGMEGFHQLQNQMARGAETGESQGLEGWNFVQLASASSAGDVGDRVLVLLAGGDKGLFLLIRVFDVGTSIIVWGRVLF